MLAGVLLHVIEPARPVYVPANTAVLLELTIDTVHDRVIGALEHLEHACGIDRTGVVGLAPRCRIERRAIERDDPMLTLTLHIANDGIEFNQVWIRVIEALGRHGAKRLDRAVDLSHRPLRNRAPGSYSCHIGRKESLGETDRSSCASTRNRGLFQRRAG